jgi:hypothetical protein
VPASALAAEIRLDETFRAFFDRYGVRTAGRCIIDSNGKRIKWEQTPIDCNLQPYSSLELRAEHELCGLKGGAPKPKRSNKGAKPDPKRSRPSVPNTTNWPRTNAIASTACDDPTVATWLEESGNEAGTREQLIDVDTLRRHMYRLGGEDKAKKACKALLAACKIVTVYTDVEPELIGRVNVRYMHQVVKSRIYPARNNWWHDIFSQRKDARAAAGSRIYVDLDIENCFPVFLEFLCKKHSIEAPELVEYNAKREEYIVQIIEHYQPQASGANSDPRRAVKSLFSAGYNGAGKDFIAKWREEHSVRKDIEDHPFVNDFFLQNSEVAETLITGHCKDVLDEVKLAMPHKERPVQTALHCVLARMETRCRDTMERVAGEHNVRMDSPQHDGSYCRLDTPIEGRDWYRKHTESMKKFDWDKLCKRMSEAIKAEHGYTVTVARKPINKPRQSSGTSIFRFADFVPNLPLGIQMEWMNRHFRMIVGQGTDSVAKITYLTDTDRIESVVTQPIGSFKQTFAGMMLPSSTLEEEPIATMQADPEDEESEAEEEHDNSAFAEWLATEGVERYTKGHRRRQTARMHDVADRVRAETTFSVASGRDFSKIKGVDAPILSIGVEYLEKQGGTDAEAMDSAPEPMDRDSEGEDECAGTDVEATDSTPEPMDCDSEAEAGDEDRGAASADPMAEPMVQDSEVEGNPGRRETKGAEDDKAFDLASHWCRSLARRVVQSIVFEPAPYGGSVPQGTFPDHLNTYSGLPYDDCLCLGSVVAPDDGGEPEVGEGVGPQAVIDPSQAAFIALQNPTARFEEVSVGAALILRHIEEEICGGDVPACLYLLRSIAYGLRYRQKSGVMPIIVGEKGTGKTTIFGTSRDKIGLLPRLYGKHWKEAGSINELMAPFSDKQELECMMVTLEEVSDFGGSTKAQRARMVEFLRMLTSGTKGHTLKHQTKDSCVKDYRNFVALINPENRDAFVIQQGDRRFAMIEGSDAYSKRAQDEGRIAADVRKAYFANLWRAIEDEACMRWIARYFVHDVRLDGWTPEDIPETEIRNEQQMLNGCSVLSFLEVWQMQADGSDLIYTKLVPKKDADGVIQDAHQEEKRTLRANYAFNPSAAGYLYKPMEVFEAFRDWCKRTNASTTGVGNLNAFGQKLKKYTHDETTCPTGVLYKRKTNSGQQYWVYEKRSACG